NVLLAPVPERRIVVSLPPVYLVPISSAWSCTQEHAGTLRPTAHLNAFARSTWTGSVGSPLTWKPIDPWMSTLLLMPFERIRSPPHDVLPVPRPLSLSAVGILMNPRTASATGSPYW